MHSAMNLDFLIQHSDLQSVLAMLGVGLALVCLIEWQRAGRWTYLFSLLLMSLLVSVKAGFIFLLAAETVSYLAIEETEGSEGISRTFQFIINIFIATICLLVSVVLNQTVKSGASIPLYVWIYFNFLGLPFQVGRSRQVPRRDTLLVYLFCFALCYRHFIGAVDTGEWSVVLLAMSAMSILVGNARASAMLAVLGLSGFSALNLAFTLPFVAIAVLPGVLATALLPLSLFAWIFTATAQTEVTAITYPALLFFAARAVYIEKPRGQTWRWIAPTALAACLFIIVGYLNYEILSEHYNKFEFGDPSPWIALATGIVFWNVCDRKIPWLARGVREWPLPTLISQKYGKTIRDEPQGETRTPQWGDFVKPSATEKLLRGHFQLTAWFGVMCIVAIAAYWLVA
jgi:hypothetical protein